MICSNKVHKTTTNDDEKSDKKSRKEKRPKRASLVWLIKMSVSYLESGYLVRVARLLVYMCPPTSMCTGAFALVSWAGRGIPWAARGETGDRVRDSRDMLLPSWKQVYRKAMGILVMRERRTQGLYTGKQVVSFLSCIRSLPWLCGRIFSLETITSALIKYVQLFMQYRRRR